VVRVLDFFNEPDDILEAFQPYYQTAELMDVTDPNLVFDLYEKLRSSGIFLWNEVEQFCVAFLTKKKSNAAVSNICKPAVDRWQHRYKSAIDAYIQSKEMFERTKKTKDAVLIANAENSFKECKQEKDRLEIFKKDLGSFVRFFEFMSQIVDYEDKELEKLSLFSRYLRPLLHEQNVQEDEVDLSNVEMSHYRLSKIREQDIKLKEDAADYKLEPSNDVGTAKPKDKKEDFLSYVIEKLNEAFANEDLTDNDMLDTVRKWSNKVRENETVMAQLKANNKEQAMLGDFPVASDDAVIASSEAEQAMMFKYLSDTTTRQTVLNIMFDMLKG
jgi:type I restriction enzyme R subunit